MPCHFSCVYFLPSNLLQSRFYVVTVPVRALPSFSFFFSNQPAKLENVLGERGMSIRFFFSLRWIFFFSTFVNEDGHEGRNGSSFHLASPIILKFRCH